MTYSIYNTSSSVTYTITDGTVNIDLDLGLVGKGYLGYGPTVNRNFLQLLENFSGASAPTKPIKGQLWYDSLNSVVKVYNGSTWSSVSGSSISASSVTLSGDLTVSGAATFYGSVVLPTLNSLAVNGALTAGSVTATNHYGIFSGPHNGTVGATTPNTGAFTTVTATTLNGTHNGILNGPHNGTVGATTPNAGAFTTLTASGATSIGGALTTTTTASFAGVTTSSGNLVASATTASTSTTTGSLVVRGGAGIAGDIYCAGTIYGTVSGSITVDKIDNTPIGSITASTGRFTTLTATGQFTVNSSNNATAIVNGGSTGVGDIGSSAKTFNTVYAKATTAQYADLAENYEADASYAPGTVVEFGGEFDVTLATVAGSSRVAGIISTNPAYLMNSHAEGNFIAAVALTGRVPCKVRGPVAKGDLLVSAGDGYAMTDNNARSGTIVGKAVQSNEDGDNVIDVVVGRF